MLKNKKKVYKQTGTTNVTLLNLIFASLVSEKRKLIRENSASKITWVVNLWKLFTDLILNRRVT